MSKGFILIVEDSPVDALITKKTIQLIDDSYEIETFDDGNEAISFAESQSSDQLIKLVLLDMNMPDLGGLEFLKKTKGIDTWKNIQIAMVSSHFAPGEKEACESYGVTTFKKKPLSEEDISEILQLN